MSTFTHPLYIFLERITTDVLEDHEGTVSIGSRTIINLRFADDIDGLAGEEESAKLVECLDKASTAYGMEIVCREVRADDKQHQWHLHRDQSKWTKLETVTIFKYLGSVITGEWFRA